MTAYYTARVTPAVGAPGPGTGVSTDDGDDRATGAAPSAGDTLRAYVALTKPRIIELLLVTTVPAMVLAARDVPGIGIGEWSWLVLWTLVGGIARRGQRERDQLLPRPGHRRAHGPDPPAAAAGPPGRARSGRSSSGSSSASISLVVMAWFVNLVAAFLTLLAIAFYVVVYTILLKRTTPQNIVIGGAAGALPPVIGWAAVTGSVALPALILFAIVFYWTPPHFWALSLRIRKDYEAARVPMLPVVRGIPETTRQIALYTLLLVAISLVLFTVARMGAIYLGAAVVLGAIFVWQAYRLWRVGTSEERSTAGAIRLYRYSITYLTLLFVAVAVDALVAIPL